MKILVCDLVICLCKTGEVSGRIGEGKDKRLTECCRRPNFDTMWAGRGEYTLRVVANDEVLDPNTSKVRDLFEEGVKVVVLYTKSKIRLGTRHE